MKKPCRWSHEQNADNGVHHMSLSESYIRDSTCSYPTLSETHKRALLTDRSCTPSETRFHWSRVGRDDCLSVGYEGHDLWSRYTILMIALVETISQSSVRLSFDFEHGLSTVSCPFVASVVWIGYHVAADICTEVYSRLCRQMLLQHPTDVWSSCATISRIFQWNFWHITTSSAPCPWKQTCSYRRLTQSIIRQGHERSWDIIWASCCLCWDLAESCHRCSLLLRPNRDRSSSNSGAR